MDDSPNCLQDILLHIIEENKIRTKTNESVEEVFRNNLQITKANQLRVHGIFKLITLLPANRVACGLRGSKLLNHQTSRTNSWSSATGTHFLPTFHHKQE